MAEKRVRCLLTAPVGSSGEVEGGLCAHRWGVWASAQEGSRRQVPKAFLGIPFLRGREQTKVICQNNGLRPTAVAGSLLRMGGQEKQASGEGGK